MNLANAGRNEREQFRERFRPLLQERGFFFCDDAPEARQQGPELQRQAAELAVMRQHCSNIIASGVYASSEDDPEQSIQMTLYDDDRFWSSTGCRHKAGEEVLMYRLKAPLCRVEGVTIRIFRVHFQAGDPIYPPVSVGIEVGNSPSSTRMVGAPQSCALSDETQLFSLPAEGVVGGYVAIRLFGKCQKQFEDMQYYIAIRTVEILGVPLDSAAVAGLMRINRNPAFRLPHSHASLLLAHLQPAQPRVPKRSFSLQSDWKEPHHQHASSPRHAGNTPPPAMRDPRSIDFPSFPSLSQQQHQQQRKQQDHRQQQQLQGYTARDAALGGWGAEHRCCAPLDDDFPSRRSQDGAAAPRGSAAGCSGRNNTPSYSSMFVSQCVRMSNQLWDKLQRRGRSRGGRVKEAEDAIEPTVPDRGRGEEQGCAEVLNALATGHPHINVRPQDLFHICRQYDLRFLGS